MNVKDDDRQFSSSCSSPLLVVEVYDTVYRLTYLYMVYLESSKKRDKVRKLLLPPCFKRL